MMISLSRFSIFVGGFLLFNVERLLSAQATRCLGTDFKGTNNPITKDERLDIDTGLGVLLNAGDNQYMVDCCGVIESWRFYVKTNPGTVDLQVWRPDGTDLLTLVGKNSKPVNAGEENAEITYIVPVSERISVLSGDYLGFYTERNPMISHKQEGGANDRYTYSTTIGVKNVGDSFDWSTATPATESRTYAVRANLGPGNTPTFTNLPNTLTLTDDTAANTLLYTVSVSDVDPQDRPTLIGLTTTVDFTFNAANGELRNTEALPVGTRNLLFRVEDQCSGIAEILTIVVNNIPPVITNLPSTYDISEDQTTEELLYTLTVTDGSLNDRVTCTTESITPTTDNFFVRLIAGTTDSYGVYVKALPSLSYNSIRQYAVLISCTDTKTPVKDTLTIFVTESTTTTDRHLTFWMDPRNIAWVTVAAILYTGLLLFCAYLIVRYGNFSFFQNFNKPSKVNTTRLPHHDRTTQRESKSDGNTKRELPNPDLIGGRGNGPFQRTGNNREYSEAV